MKLFSFKLFKILFGYVYLHNSLILFNEKYVWISYRPTLVGGATNLNLTECSIWESLYNITRQAKPGYMLLGNKKNLQLIWFTKFIVVGSEWSCWIPVNLAIYHKLQNTVKGTNI